MTNVQGQRILLLTDTLNLTGMPTITLQVARLLISRGANVRVISLVDGLLRNEFEKLGAKIQIIPWTRGWSPLQRVRDGRFVLHLYNEVRQFHPDSLYASSSYMFPAIRIADRLGVPVIWNIQESSIPGSRWMPRAFRFKPTMVFASETTRSVWDPIIGESPAHIIPNGLDLEPIDEYRRTHTQAEIRASLNIPNDAFVVSIVGTTCKRKGQLDFVNAALELATHRPENLVFTMVGAVEGDYLEGLTEKIRTHGLEKKFIIVPPTPDIHAYYLASDILCCCSYEESQPLVILEGMAHNLPIVSTNVWGIPEQVVDEESALLVPPGDVSALVYSIERFLDDPNLATRLGKRARNRLEKQFSIEQFDSRILKLFQSLLGVDQPLTPCPPGL